MHKLNILILGPESFVSTFIELESYFKFNISSNQNKLPLSIKSNLHGIIFYHDTFQEDQLKKYNCLKILATNSETKISKNYDIVLKLPTTIEEINNLIERSAAKKEFAKNSSILIKSYLLDKNEKRLTKDGNSVILTEKEIQLLEILLNKKKEVSKDDILSLVWRYSSESDTHTVETHIYRLRKKISEKFLDEKFILNNKKGYYL
tara:strand:- start:1436 stop:2050 length:615 start_codon:yes stop_codon:yes gene_type:complete